MFESELWPTKPLLWLLFAGATLLLENFVTFDYFGAKSYLHVYTRMEFRLFNEISS